MKSPFLNSFAIATVSITLLINPAHGQPPGPPPAEAPTDNILQSGPLPPGGPPPQQLQTPPDPNATPVPSVGDLGEFTYAPSSQYEDVSVVFPSAGGEAVLVASDFLEAAIQSGSPPQQILQDAQMFEALNNRVAQEFARTFYPDQSAGVADVPRTELSGTNHNITVEQDGAAGPYARVKVTDKDGNTVYEGSVSARIAERILNNPAVDTDQKIAELQRLDFQLPEQARQNFNNLSAEELIAIVAEKPDVQKRSFIKMLNVYESERQKKEERAAGSTATAHAETPSISRPTPRPSRQARSATPGATAETGQSETTQNATGEIADRETDGIHLPEIIGILLGAIALGIFIFGFWKSRRP